MIMSMLRSAAALVAATLWWASAGLAQDEPKKDEGLEGLLKKLEEKSADDPPAPQKTDTAKADADQPADKGGEKAEKGGEVDPKDKALDSLLEKLGETEDKPDAVGKPSPKAEAPDDPKSQPKPDQPPQGKLKDNEKKLDEHLEELTGRKRKKKDEDQEGKEGNPLSDVIKQMRDVEERLGKPDTGEETRKRQDQIVKRLDSLIEELRPVQGQAPGRKIRRIRQGNQQANNQGNTPGAQARNNTGRGTGASKPEKPKNNPSTANSKDVWGHLDPQLREEMENVFKEESLPSKRELIEKYYLSVSKKGQSRGE
jgi:hypothetical protein